MLFAISDEAIVSIIAAIPIISAAIVSIIIALKTGKKVEAVQADMKAVKADVRQQGHAVAEIQRGIK